MTLYGSWLDEGLSCELPVLRDKGEGQHLEFMQSYPLNGHELSKEIAAFASSNAGVILIGVGDDGSLVGLDGLDTAAGRDQLCRRIEGVCSGNVRPAITPVIKFGLENDRVVLAIEIPRGTEPIYYSSNTPYIRHLSQSRPAQPHEVIERVAAWIRSNPLASHQSNKSSKYLSELARLLIEILIDGDELKERLLKPWFDILRSQLMNYAAGLRQLAADGLARVRGIEDPLRDLATKLDSVATFRVYLGPESWRELSLLMNDAEEAATRLKATQIDGVPLSSEARESLFESIRSRSRELNDLAKRADGMANEGRIEDLQQEAAVVGRDMLRVSYYCTSDGFDDDDCAKLRLIGRSLHLLETRRVYMDGGRSMDGIVSTLRGLNDELQCLLQEASWFRSEG